MKFEIDTAESLNITDQELERLLCQVYVDGGYVKSEQALVLFKPEAVRKRGILLCARCKQSADLMGMVIVVQPDSPACQLAKENEVEMHLLAVKPEYRGEGLGKQLVSAAISQATDSGYKKMILWTQLSMDAAQQLYKNTGFFQVDQFEKNGRDFLLYRRSL